MKAALFCFSDSGAVLSLRLCDLLGIGKENVHSVPGFAQKYGFTPHGSVCADMGELFDRNDALIFVCACGIAVRDIAPHLKNKMTDPAVVVIDDRGRYVIPILSGHVGGANDLAVRIADMIGAVPVVTTATDGAHRFACDAWASTHGCAISSMRLAKKVSAEILVHDVPVSSDRELPALPDGIRQSEDGKLGIYIGIDDREPYGETLRLIPRIVTVGVGCRRGTNADVIENAVKNTLKEYNIDIRAVERIVSIDVKKDEEGIRGAAERLNAELKFFTAEELNAVPGEFTESEFVRKTVGTGNVCERAAALSGGKLIIRKTAGNGVTVAAAEREWRITF